MRKTQKKILGMVTFLVAASLGSTEIVMAQSPGGIYSQIKPRIKGKKLEKLVAKAQQHPLGSKENPVRVFSPVGERLYLMTLLCADKKTPQFSRDGNDGVGAFGNIVDVYSLSCEGSEPAAATVYMDMYHPGYQETRSPDGFGTRVSPTATPEQVGAFILEGVTK